MVTPTRRKRSPRLGVWMNGVHVGTWRLGAQGDEFQYTESWLHHAQSRPLSISMPLLPGNEPYRGVKVSAWFDNLLPDSTAIRERLARRHQATAVTAFALLERIGRDCVGAVQVVPEDEDPGDVRTITTRPLDDAGVAQALRDALLPTAPNIEGDGPDLRLSLAGAQEKTALLWHEGRWHMPTGPTPTTHILKLPLGLAGNTGYDIEHSVQNEWLCSKVLQAYGLPVARSQIERFQEHTVLVVERFDRELVPSTETTAAWIQRLPQEDFCQATGTPPSQKYESDGGPGMDQILGLLAGATNAVGDRRVFLKAQILFWMLNAIDGHAKNFSVFMDPGGRFSLTPLYDVLSASPFVGEGPRKLSRHRLKLAMAVRATNPHWKMNEILRRHWSAVSQRTGLGNLAEEIIAELIDATPNVINRIEEDLPRDFPDSISQPIIAGLREKVKALSEMPAA